MVENVEKSDKKRSWKFWDKKRDELANEAVENTVEAQSPVVTPQTVAQESRPVISDEVLDAVKEHEAELYRRRGGADMYSIDPTSIQERMDSNGLWMKDLTERMLRSKQVTTQGAEVVINDVVDMLEQSRKEFAQKLASSQDWFVLSSEYMPVISLEEVGWSRRQLVKLIDDPSLDELNEHGLLRRYFGYNEKTGTVSFSGYIQIMFAKMTQEVSQCMSDRRQDLEQLYDKGYSEAKGNIDYSKNRYMLNQENLDRAQNVQDYFETTHNEQELTSATDSPEMTR